jgi:hypothetical protein
LAAKLLAKIAAGRGFEEEKEKKILRVTGIFLTGFNA